MLDSEAKRFHFNERYLFHEFFSVKGSLTPTASTDSIKHGGVAVLYSGNPFSSVRVKALHALASKYNVVPSHQLALFGNSFNFSKDDQFMISPAGSNTQCKVMNDLPLDVFSGASQRHQQLLTIAHV